MNRLDDIDGIGEKAIRLFEAVDISSLDDLARQKTGELYQRLFETNRAENIFGHLPPIHTVEEWVAAARILRGVKGGARTGAGARASGNGGRDVLPADELVDVPAAEWMRLYNDAAEARILEKPETEAARAKASSSKEPAVQSTGAKLAKHGEIRSGEGLLPAAESERPVSLRLPKKKKKKEIELAPAGDLVLESVPGSGGSHSEKQADTSPDRTRRGLLHPRPRTVYGGAFVAVVTRLLFFAVLVGMPLGVFIFQDQLLYFAIIPVLLLVFAVLYAIYASRVRCRVCGAHLLVSRKCLKHENSHRVPGFGYVGSLALHALIFSWFRCQYCGTPMKLRE